MAKKNRLVGFASRALLSMEMPTLFFRNILTADSWIKHSQWIPSGLAELSVALAAKGCGLKRHRVKARLNGSLKADSALVDAFFERETVNGVNLFNAIAYSVCAETERLPHELQRERDADALSITRWATYALTASEEIERSINRLSPQAVLSCQGFLVESAILRDKARKLGIPSVNWEISIERSKMRVDINDGNAVFFPKMLKNAAAGAAIDSLNLQKHSHHTSGIEAFQWPSGRFRILFLAQVYSDASIIFKSSGSMNPVSLVRSVMTASKSMNGFLIIKAHPKEISGSSPIGKPLSSLTLRKLMDHGFPWSSQGGEDFFYDTSSNLDTARLIESADIVVAFNSQGALEAAMAGKETIIAADSYFSELDVFWRIRAVEDLGSILAQIASGCRKGNHNTARAAVRDHLERQCIGADASSVAKFLLDVAKGQGG